mgnify:CR=1 FL=1
MEKIIGRGAEAILIQKDKILTKRRVKKSYRIQVLDEKLRKSRTKKEGKLIEKAGKLIPVPKIIKTSEQSKEIEMEFIEGKKLSEHLDNLKNAIQICRQIGKNIAKLHDAGIIHGDLTTSNMILAKSKDKSSSGVDGQGTLVPYLFDFGLGFESDKIEDKAVDLHLIKQALEAKHFKNYKKFFKAVIDGYKSSKNYKATLARLEKVEKRGRYKRAC